MRKRIVYAFAALLALTGCDEKMERAEEKGRTVLAYMVASNLSEYLDNNINDMIAAASAKNLNKGHLIVFYSKSNSSAELFEIREGAGGVVTRFHIRDYENRSAISPQTMREVIDEVKRLYPADSYGMILSSHGTAWLPGSSNAVLRAFAEEDGQRMEITDLADALPDHAFDFLLFDACSMGAVECVYELRNKASFIVASPSETLVYGVPYQTALPWLFTETAALDKFVGGYVDFYRQYRYPYGNMAVIRTDRLEKLAGLTREILGGTDTHVFSQPLPDWQLLSSWSGAPTGLYDFEDVIGRMATTQQQRDSLAVFVREAVPSAASTELTWCSNGRYALPVTRFSGLSLYPMQKHLSGLNRWYEQLEWYRAVYP